MLLKLIFFLGWSDLNVLDLDMVWGRNNVDKTRCNIFSLETGYGVVDLLRFLRSVRVQEESELRLNQSRADCRDPNVGRAKFSDLKKTKVYESFK